MALNCPQRSEDGEPCGECESCLRIWGGHTALDVVEIDAASNRGVEDARDLRARAQYAPSEDGRFKVYILDEAHMLTREAWNALLKILEEPPPRVIFVFATTEPQKIQQSAAPILSRCQRFDFRRIGIHDLVTRLQEVLTREGLEGPEDALRTIARKADGGMRDGLSLLDQVIALTGGPVSQEAVRQILGLVEEERYVELMDILLERKAGRIFAFVDELVSDGYDLTEFYHGLVGAIRLLLRVRLEPDADLADVREDLRDGFLQRAARFDPVDLVRMLALSAELETSGSLRRTVNPRMLVEMLLLRLAYLDKTVGLEELIRGLGGAPLSGDALLAGAPSTVGGMATAGGPPPSQGGPASEPPNQGGPASEPPNQGGPASEPPNLSAPVASHAGVEAAPADPPAPVAIPQTSASGPTSVTAEAELAAPVAALAQAPEPPAVPVTDLTDDPVQAWRRLLADRADLPNGLGPFLQAGVVRTDPQGAVEVSLPPGPGLERLSQPAVRRAIEGVLHRHIAGAPPLVFVETGAVEGPQGRITTASVRQSRLRELIDQEPLLGKAVEELDLELLD